eukprot:gene22806-27553_t
MQRRPCLVIDAFNQCIVKLRGTHTIAQWQLDTERRIQSILRLSTDLALHPVFVVDTRARLPNDEVYLRRKAKEVSSGKILSVPYNIHSFICELVLKYGSDLIYDNCHSADDIIATYALLSDDKSLVLSRDTDFFRYDNGALERRVYYVADNDWVRIIKARVLQDSSSAKLAKLSPTNLHRHCIEDFDPVFVKTNTEVGKLLVDDRFVRGSSSPHAEAQGKSSLVMAARPFRRALYTSVVRETFPIWNNGKCDWVDDIVYPLTDADPETDPIIIATALLQEVDGEYDERHAGAALLMGCELAAFARGTSMLRELERTGSADKPADWKVASLTRNASVILERVKDETATAKALIPYDNANAIVKRYLMDKNADVRTLAVKALGKISTRDGLIGGRYSIEDTVVKSLKDDHLEGVEAGKVIDAIAERFKFDVDENVRR